MISRHHSNPLHLASASRYFQTEAGLLVARCQPDGFDCFDTCKQSSRKMLSPYGSTVVCNVNLPAVVKFNSTILDDVTAKACL